MFRGMQWLLEAGRDKRRYCSLSLWKECSPANPGMSVQWDSFRHLTSRTVRTQFVSFKATKLVMVFYRGNRKGIQVGNLSLKEIQRTHQVSNMHKTKVEGQVRKPETLAHEKSGEWAHLWGGGQLLLAEGTWQSSQEG